MSAAGVHPPTYEGFREKAESREYSLSLNREQAQSSLTAAASSSSLAKSSCFSLDVYAAGPSEVGLPENHSMDFDQLDVDRLFGFLDPEGKPYMDSKGDEYIVRRLFPTGKPKFKAPKGSGSRPYFSPLMPDGYLEDVNIPLVLIEGPVKVDSCYEHIPTGFCCVGLTGTWNTKDRRDENGKWNPANDTRLLPELKAIPMRGRKVIILFDSDIEDNISVDDAATDIGNWTRKRGARPHRCTLPSEPDGSKNGADDFLVRHGADQLILKLQQPKVIGYPLPAPLLTEEGDIRHDLDPTEIEEAIYAAAQIHDISVLDAVTRRLCKKLGRKYDELVIQIEEARAEEKDSGFLVTGDKLNQPSVDSRWVIPELLPRRCISSNSSSE